MGCLSLFTSCVDGDYYDLYDDEGEYISPRNKKGKDSPGAYELDGYLYSFLQSEGCESGWYYAECAACCYSNVTNSSKFDSRIKVISEQYGCINNETVALYRYGVTSNASGYLISTYALARALGWNVRTTYDMASLVANNSDINWNKVAVVVDGLGHVGLVTGAPEVQRLNNGYRWVLTYKDQYGSNNNCYFGITDDGNVLVDRIDGFIMAQ